MPNMKGWKKDVKDERDFLWKTMPVIPFEKLPDEIDLRDKMSRIENQGEIGSCTANVAVGSLEYLKRKKLQRKFICFKVCRDLSRLFVYYNTRSLSMCEDVDCGATIRDTIKAIAKWGACYEKTWPYDIGKWSEKPELECYDEAEKYKATLYYRAQNVLEVQNALAQGLPVAFGAILFESFNYVAVSGVVKIPEEGEHIIGAHAMLIVGYEKEDSRFIVRNSWGENWGRAGYCYMPFDYCKFGDWVDDFWVVKE